MGLDVVADREADGAIRLRLAGFGGLDPCEYPAIVGALGAHLGLDADALRKAASTATSEPPDPRFPALAKLVKLARSDWEAWGDALVDRVVDLYRTGSLVPMSEDAEWALRELFAAHEVAIVARIAGRGMTDDAVRLLRDAGLMLPAGPSMIELAWRLGRQVSSLKGPPGLPTLAEERAPIADTIRALLAGPMTDEDHAALGYIERRGAVYMRRPAQLTSQGISRVLSDEELAVVRGVIKADPKGASWRRVAADLRSAARTTSLLNDFDRVAKTELHYAHAEGALRTLREEAALVGDKDPMVYKLAAPDACHDCRRIWGPMSDPKRYRLSEVVDRNGGAGNFGLPRAQWGPCVGPIHPNCTEGPLHLWHQDVHDLVQELAGQLRTRYGR